METMTQPRSFSRQTTTERAARADGLLRCGVIAGPLFLLIALLQVVTRDGFDITRHALSFLSIGHWGWVQITNFIVTGILFLAAASGMREVLQEGKGRKWGPRLIAALGVGLIGGGVFVADPAFGFPPGTPDGMPDELTVHGMLHGVAGGIGFLSLIAACFVFAKRYAGTDRRRAIASAAVGSIFLLASIGSGVAPGKPLVNVGLAVALTLAFAWTSALSAKLRRESIDV
ncbi:MAG: DUF998 domain-containing protein [Actinomycetota bacterium]|nr:DUF998 domain-containing protein [Actinomycetota bacterium]